jgi:hypothetical protein
MEEAIRWNYTSVLNVVFLALTALLLIRFFRTGGPEMLKMMSSSGHNHLLADTSTIESTLIIIDSAHVTQRATPVLLSHCAPLGLPFCTNAK